MAENKAITKPKKPARGRVGFWRWVWRITAGTFAVFVVVLALFIGLFRVAVPLLPDFQQRIEAAATDALGFPTSVGSVDARWRLRGPELVFDDVVVRTRDNVRALLRANRLRVAVDALALVRGGSIKPSSITITGTQLVLRRDADGIWYVQDIPVDSLRSADQQLTAPWGIADGVFGLQNLELGVIDDLKGTTLELPDIDIDVTVQQNVLTVLGEFEFVRRGPRVEFSIDADGRADALDSVVWSGFVGGDNLDWLQLEKALPQTPAWSTEDPVDMSVWLRSTGRALSEAKVSIDATDIEVASRQQTVARVAGDFYWSGDSRTWTLTGNNVQISASEAAAPASLSVGVSSLNPAGNIPGMAGMPASETESESSHTQVTFSATEVFLEPVAVLAAPLDEKLSEWITELSPRGQISGLEGFVEVQGDKLMDFGLAATLEGVGLDGTEGRPGFNGLSARVYGGKSAGGVELQRAVQMSFPGILREMVTMPVAQADVSWKSENGALRLDVMNIELENADIHVTGQMGLERTSAEDSLRAEIDLLVDRLDLAQAYRYFPVNKFKEPLLKWLDGALTAGTGTEGRFTLRGPLNKFPYRNPDDGEFVASIRLNDATMNYARNWPAATELDAELTFERNGLRATVDDARLLTLPVGGAQASIEDFKDAIVVVEGAVTAQLDDMRAYLDATPLVKNWGAGWPDAQFYGNGSAQLNLTIPTRRRQDTQFDVALQFDETRFQFRDWRQTATGLQGELRASRAGLSATGVRGFFLDEPVEIGVTPSTSDGYTSDIVLKGNARPSSLARNLNASLADHLSGTADWTATIALPKANQNAPLQVRLRSPLQGMAVTLPTPLSKSAEQSRFADMLLTVVDEELLALAGDYGDDTNVIARIRRSEDGFWSVPQGELRFGGGTAQLPDDEVVRVMGSVSTLDMSAIVDFAQRYPSDRPWIDFGTADLAVSELKGLGQEFGATTLSMVHSATGYLLGFVGDRLSGELKVPADITPESPITGEFETVRWATTGDGEPIDPSKVPSLRSEVENFWFNDYEFGSLVAHLEARQNLVAVREFTTTAPDFNTRTTGSWVFGEESSTTYLVSELKSTNVRNTFKALGQAEFLEASEASARVEMTWPNGWTPDYLQTVEGELSVSVGPGRLRSVDPGAGRVFGLLSVGALPRRLNLDFRDVFDSGFGFDSITGDFVIGDGDAVTDNLALSGPAANVVIVGRTGLIEKDYDQTAVVYANFGSSLPIAGALAGGPAVGAALLVVSEIFKKPLQNMGKVSYSITGGWDEPVVARTGSAQPDRPAANGDAVPASEGTDVDSATDPDAT